MAESSHRDYVYIKRITSLEIENEKLRRRLHFASNTISSAQDELVTFQKEQSEDTRKLQRTLVIVRKRYDDLKRNVIASRVRKVLLRVTFRSWKSQAVVPEVQVPESKFNELQDELSETKRELTRLRIHKILGSFETRLVTSRATKLRTYLHRWRYGSIEEKKLSRAFRVLGDVAFRNLRDALKVWKVRTREISLVFKVMKRLELSSIAAAYTTWKERTRELKISHAEETRNAMAAELARARRGVAVMSKVGILRRLMKMKLRVPFDTWKDNTLYSVQKREEMGMALSRLLRHCNRSRSNVIREFFWVWLDRTTRMKSKASRTRTIMRRTISRIRHRNLNMAIRRWRVCCLRSREETILQRLRRSSTSRSVCALRYHSWKLEHRQQHSNTGTRCALLALECGMARMQSLQIARGFRLWREFVWSERVGIVDERSRRTRVQRMLRKWIERKTAKAFCKWRDVVTMAQHQEQTMNRFVLHVKNSKISRSFMKWIEFVRASQDFETAGAKMIQCLVRIANRDKARAFSTWAESVRHLAKHHREIVFNHQLSILEERLRGQKQLEAIRAVERSILHWTRKRLASSFNRWRDVLECESNHKVTMLRFVKTCMNARMGQAFHSWSSQTHQATHLKEFVKRCVRGWRKKNLQKGFKTWYFKTKDVNRQREKYARTIELMEKTLRHMRYKMLARAFTKLRYGLRQKETESRVVRVVRKCVRGWTRARLSKGFRKLRESMHRANSLETRKHRMARVILHIARQRLASAWNAWVVFAIRSKQLDESLAVTRVRSAATIDRVMKRMLRGVLSKAYSKWCDVLRHEQRARQLLARILRRIKHSKVASAIDRWKYCVFRKALEDEKLRAKLHAVEMTIRRLLHRSLSVAMRTWCDLVHSSRAVNHRNQVMTRVLRHVGHRKLTSAWNAWSSFTLRSQQQENLLKLHRNRVFKTLKYVTVTWKMKNLSRAMHSWKQVIKRDRDSKSLLRRVVSRLTHLQLASAFDRWCARQRKFGRDQEIFKSMLRVCGHVLHKHLSMAWRRWTEFHRLLARREREMSRIIRRLQHRRLSAAVATWKRGALESRDFDLLQMKKRRVMKILLGKKHLSRVANLRLGFQKWKAGSRIVHAHNRYREQFQHVQRELYLLQVDSATSRVRNVLEKMKRRSLAIGFSTLVQNTLGTQDVIRRRRRLLSFFVTRTHRLTLRTAFDAIRRQAMLHVKIRLDRLEAFLSKEKADKLRFGMKTFLIVCIKTIKSKERLQLLRAFNKIFQYGVGLLHERNRFMQKKHKEVLAFVRRLRDEIVDDDEGENEEPQKRGDFLRTPPRRKQFPRTPIERSLSPRFRKSGHTYKPHQHAQPPPIPKSAMLERHSFAARRMIHTTRNVVERWLLRTAFTSWIQTVGSPVKPSTHHKRRWRSVLVAARRRSAIRGTRHTITANNF